MTDVEGTPSDRPTPLAAGSISLRLYPHDLAPAATIDEVVAQAQLAERVGFDGVMLSEHHGGFPNYLPNPLLAATWVLAATERIWAAPCPLLLPLRPVTQVVEDLAWTSQRFPGRLGAGFAVGAHELDFDLAGVPFDEAVERFKAGLAEVAVLLAGRAPSPLAADPAVAALADEPVPAVSAAQSPAAARRAARHGLGVLLDSLISTTKAAAVTGAHVEAGGAGARILVRRPWVGEPPAAAVDAQLARYRFAASAATQDGWASGDGLVTSTDPAEVAERLAADLGAAGCDTLNLRVYHAGLHPSAVRHQIERLGTDVLPTLRDVLARHVLG